LHFGALSYSKIKKLHDIYTNFRQEVNLFN
jgi:hypothetical protein